MCGILGFNWEDTKLLRKGLDTIEHRGPDASGIFVDKGISLGHRRLSIIDLSRAGKQPMSNEDGTVWIIFNGEIYNYIELREELKVKGVSFLTNTDTEVMLQSYLHWGEACVNHFNGMWSLVIYDS